MKKLIALTLVTLSMTSFASTEGTDVENLKRIVRHDLVSRAEVALEQIIGIENSSSRRICANIGIAHGALSQLAYRDDNYHNGLGGDISVLYDLSVPLYEQCGKKIFEKKAVKNYASQLLRRLGVYKAKISSP